jgi:hypothetical protein
MNLRVEQQCHGYKNGHQLLAGSLRLPRVDQDIVDRMSDISGPLRPGETFAPYLTAYPLPSRQYYVLSKTWQDLNAPRAGCVLTRSLLLEMSDWSSLDYPASLIDLFDPIDKSTPSAKGIDFITRPVRMEPVKTTRVVSLVEALFLEDRNPIVMFDEPEAELISLRLLSALWPAFRQSFSICTLSLSPRSIAGKSFDLVFSLRDAKSRFAQWQGRVFDAQPFSKVDVARHRWSTITTEHIFNDDPPSLVSLDVLGLLGSSQSADEASLRLALLWNELLEKAETSPTAILGLLDILRSRGKFTSQDVMPFLPVLLRGIELAKATLTVSEVLGFILTLVGKFPSRRPPIDMLHKIREVLSFSASKDPQIVLDLYRETTLTKELRSPLVTAGLGEGLARTLRGSGLLTFASQFKPEDQLRLMAFSNEWMQSIISTTVENSPSSWDSWLTRALEFPDDDLRTKARKKIVPHLSSSKQVSLLRAMLENVDGNTVVSVAEQIRALNGFSVAAFDQPLIEAARSTGVIERLRNEIVKARDTEAADRFLSATLTLQAPDVEWLFQSVGNTRQRLAGLISNLLRNASDESVRNFLQVEKLSSRLEQLFLEELPSRSMDLARIMLLGYLPTSRLLGEGTKVLGNVDIPTRNSLSRLMLERGLADASDSDNSTLELLIAESAAFSDARTLVFMALSKAVNADRVLKNVVMLDHAKKTLRRSILNEIEVISDLLTHRYELQFTDRAVHSWGSLLKDSGSVNPYGQGRAAAMTLSFALKHRSKPYSELVIASFPLVYEQLRTGQESPGLLSFLFTDWDRCKTARKELSWAFLHSDWPAIDLVKAVSPTGDLDKVLRTVSREKEGEAFLVRLEAAFSQLSKADRRDLENVIGPILKATHESSSSFDS